MAGGLVTVGVYSTPYEANLVRGELEAFAVHAYLADAATVGTNWLWSNMLGGVKVQVPESEVEEARRVLGLENDPGEIPEASEPEVVACLSCGSTETTEFVDKRFTFFSWLMLGLPILPVVTRRECGQCGRIWKP